MELLNGTVLVFNGEKINNKQILKYKGEYQYPRRPCPDIDALKFSLKEALLQILAGFMPFLIKSEKERSVDVFLERKTYKKFERTYAKYILSIYALGDVVIKPKEEIRCKIRVYLDNIMRCFEYESDFLTVKVLFKNS